MKLTLDRPARLLLLSNAATIAIALWEGWTLSETMWVYWWQNIVIGFFTVLRLLRLGETVSEGEVTVNGRPVKTPAAAKWFLPGFFVIHYGLFHLAYYHFLSIGNPLPEGVDLLSMGVCIGGFLVHHAVSYRENFVEDLKRRSDAGAVMTQPYRRVTPMHLTIIFGSFFARDSVWGLLLFLCLKTAADVSMHLAEHGKLQLDRSQGREGAG